MEKIISRLEQVTVFLVWLSVIAYAATAHAEGHGIIRAPEDLIWNLTTITLCLAGWFLSWGSEWATEYVQKQKCFTKFALDHLPRLAISLVSTFAVYAMLPELGTMLGFDLKFGNLGAFVCGLGADFIVQRIRGVIPKKELPPPPEAGGP